MSPSARGCDINPGTTSKALRTRARLMEAATQAFAELGYENATMDDIAGRAEVAHGTVYRYFANKEAVVLAVVAEKVTGLAEAIRDALADPSDEGVTRAIRRFLSHVSSNRDLVRIWKELTAIRSAAADLRRRLRVPFIDAIEMQVRRAQVAGHLAEGVDVAVASRALAAMVDNFAYVWFVLEDRPGGDDELDRLAATLAVLWGGALGHRHAADGAVNPFRHLRTASGP